MNLEIIKTKNDVFEYREDGKLIATEVGTYGVKVFKMIGGKKELVGKGWTDRPIILQERLTVVTGYLNPNCYYKSGRQIGFVPYTLSDEQKVFIDSIRGRLFVVTDTGVRIDLETFDLRNYATVNEVMTQEVKKIAWFDFNTGKVVFNKVRAKEIEKEFEALKKSWIRASKNSMKDWFKITLLEGEE